jgi:two-component system chemotaxis response regulator CheB
MGNRNIIVVGGSAGAIEALRVLVQTLPANFPASLFVVVHIAPWYDSALAQILAREGGMRAVQARDGDNFEHGTIYVAPPDRHLLIEHGRTVLAHGPREHRFRPAIDPLFRSAALHYPSQTIGVVLSGLLDDGVSGLWQIKRAGGVAVVQDPKNAVHSQMPNAALENVEVDHCVAIGEMGSLLARLAASEAPKQIKPKADILKHMNVEERIVKMGDGIADIREIGTPSQYTCPDCSGTLYQMQDSRFPRYRCRTGHTYAELTLTANQRVSAEESLWAAMRSLREKSELLHQRAQSRSKSDRTRAKLERLSKAAEKQALQVRDMIERLERDED